MLTRKLRKMPWRPYVRPHSSKNIRKRWWQHHGHDTNESSQPPYGPSSSPDSGFEKYMQRHPELRSCGACNRHLDMDQDRVLLIPGPEGNARKIKLICIEPGCVYDHKERGGQIPSESARLYGTPRDVITSYWEQQRQSVKPVREKDYVPAPTKTLDQGAVDASPQRSNMEDIIAQLNRLRSPSYHAFRRRF